MDSNQLIERIKYIMDKNGMSISEFSKKADINQSNMSNMLSGKRKIGDAIINKIVLSFDINKEWLLTGEGEMLKKTKSSKSNAVFIENPNFVMIPIVSQYAYAGYLSGYADPEYIEALPTMPFFIDHQVNGKYRGFEVKGDSMDDGSANSLIEGDMLVCRQIKQELWQYKLHIKKWFFVIVHKTEGILVKQITDHDTETGDITIHSLNNFYEDRVLNLNDVAQLFNVVQVSRALRL